MSATYRIDVRCEAVGDGVVDVLKTHLADIARELDEHSIGRFTVELVEPIQIDGLTGAGGDRVLDFWTDSESDRELADAMDPAE